MDKLNKTEKIIVVGYPKSGSTWVTRLVAELVNCPVKGFLYGKDNSEMAIEGFNRNSNYKCYKSHHQYHELIREDRENSKIIYVVRDPRDITLSGSYYFYNLHIFSGIKINNKIGKSIINLLNKFFRRTYGSSLMRNRMINAVINGDARVHHWCRISWKKHLAPYLQSSLQSSEILVVKYEDLLNNPFIQSKRITEFVGVNRDEKEIKSAIKNQSFEILKKKFIENGEIHKAKFLRKGSSRQWKNGLNKREKLLFIKSIAPEIDSLGYERW